ncbi:MAG: ATP phosphoribosyltransferase regulatory subunit, partial [Thermaerobacter sp.]|nr:ATP phosphoribosyltransferase regulatory subunit [Thermaerobacter sp.]
MGELQKPRGTRDVLPEEASRWRLLEDRARQVAARYGYGELRTPLFEVTELLLLWVGEDTCMVDK